MEFETFWRAEKKCLFQTCEFFMNQSLETEISLLTNRCYFLEDDLLVSRLVKCCFGGCIIASYDNCFLGSPCLCCHPCQVGSAHNKTVIGWWYVPRKFMGRLNNLNIPSRFLRNIRPQTLRNNLFVPFVCVWTLCESSKFAMSFYHFFDITDGSISCM